MKRVLFLLLLLVSLGTLAAQQSDDEKLALQYYKDKEYDKAIELFEKIQAKKPSSYIYYYYYNALLELERYSELEKLVKKQIKSFANVQRYKVDLGYVYERSGDNTKAEKQYQELLKNLQAKEYAVQELYSAFYSKLKIDYAIEAIQKGRRLMNNPQLLSKELINLYQYQHQTDKVIEEVLSMVKDDNEQKYMDQAKTAIQNLLMDDEDNQKYNTVKVSLQKVIQKNPNNLSYLTLLYWVNQLHKEYGEALILAKAIDKRMKTECVKTYELACLAADNRDYSTAIEALEYIINLGDGVHNYNQARMKILDVRYSQLTSTSPVKMTEAVRLMRDYQTLIDENGIQSSTMDWIRKYAHLLAFYVNKPQEAINVLNQAMSFTRDAKEKNQFKIDLADVQLYMGNVWDATLNYSQVDKDLPNDALGNEAKFKNAKLSFYIGEFEWAKSQLDVLSAATSKLVANDAIYFSLLISDNQEEDEEEDEDDEDTTYLLFENPSTNLPLKKYAEADFLIFQNKDEQALVQLDSVITLSPLGSLVDDALYQKALIYIKQKNYLGAESLLKQIEEKHGGELLGDDAVFKLAELYEYYLKDIPQAMEYYLKIMQNYSGSLYVVEARKHYRALRGDTIE